MVLLKGVPAVQLKRLLGVLLPGRQLLQGMEGRRWCWKKEQGIEGEGWGHQQQVVVDREMDNGLASGAAAAAEMVVKVQQRTWIWH